MNLYFNLHSVRKILITLLLIISLFATIFDVRTKSNLDSSVGNLKFGASIAITFKSAAALSRHVDKVLKVTNLPLSKQTFEIVNLNFLSIKDEISTVLKVSPTLIGVDRPKKYLTVFQNSAEARGTRSTALLPVIASEL